MKATITINVDTDGLRNIEDSYLAALWHAAQAAPADLADRQACELVDDIGKEIVRRWLGQAPALLYERSTSMHYWHTLQQHGAWTGPGQTWQPRAVDAPAAALEGRA